MMMMMMMMITMMMMMMKMEMMMERDGNCDRVGRVHLSLNLEPYCAELSRVYGVNDILGKLVSSGYFVLTKKRKENKHLL